MLLTRLLLIVLTVIGLHGDARAGAEPSGALGNCTHAGGACTGAVTVVNGLSPITLAIDKTAGTIATGEVLCVVHPGATAQPVKNIAGAAATFTDDTIFTTNEVCYSLQVSIGTCTGCTFTAFYHGIPAPRGF